LFVERRTIVIGEVRTRVSPAEEGVRRGAAIALIGLRIALQTSGATPYDEGVPGEHDIPPALTPMDDGRVADAGPHDRPADLPPSLDSTFDLLERVRAGDGDALNQLFARYLPPLRRWASGRLPHWTRDLMDTDDLVQETVLRAIRRIDRFESRHEGALQAYLRQAVVNRIRDEVRRSRRSPAAVELAENERDQGTSPLEAAIGAEAVDRYESALARLRPEEREAIVARVEMDGSYQDVAAALGKPSADAARMAVSRALLRLAEEMSREQV
jgi:RNA polymerase sigma factor (sigma-70 family)